MSNNNNISNLWKKEDWLAVWIGFIVIAIGCISILTQSFDFSAAKFSTWHWWENVHPYPELRLLRRQVQHLALVGKRRRKEISY